MARSGAGNLATTHLGTGDARTAADFAARALDAHRTQGSIPSAFLDPLFDLSDAHRLLGHPTEALNYAQEALNIAEESGGAIWRAAALIRLGHAQRAVGRSDEALETYQVCATEYRNLGDRLGEAATLKATGDALVELGRAEEAAGFHRAAATSSSSRQPPMHPA